MFAVDEVLGDMCDGLDEHEVPGAVTMVPEVGVVTRCVAVLIRGAHVNTELHQRLQRQIGNRDVSNFNEVIFEII